jgi:hypothetical protein
VLADLGCLTDDYARSVIDEEVRTDSRTRMDIDPGA